MEIEKMLQIPAAYFYDKVVDSVIFDIRKQTGKTLDPTQLQDFEYQKNRGTGNEAMIKITKNKVNEAFHYVTKSRQSRSEIKYDITARGANQSNIRYVENTEPFGKLQRFNVSLTNSVLGFLRRRNLKKMFSQIEQSY